MPDQLLASEVQIALLEKEQVKLNVGKVKQLEQHYKAFTSKHETTTIDKYIESVLKEHPLAFVHSLIIVERGETPGPLIRETFKVVAENERFKDSVHKKERCLAIFLLFKYIRGHLEQTLSIAVNSQSKARNAIHIISTIPEGQYLAWASKLVNERNALFYALCDTKVTGELVEISISSAPNYLAKMHETFDAAHAAAQARRHHEFVCHVVEALNLAASLAKRCLQSRNISGKTKSLFTTEACVTEIEAILKEIDAAQASF